MMQTPGGNAFHSPQQAYQAYQTYALPMHMQAQYHHQHAQQATYKGAPNADQFMGNQSREFMIQSHHSIPAHAHMHRCAPAQAPIEAHKVPNPTERPAVAASSLAVRDPDEVG